MIFNINKKYTLKDLKSLFYLACISVVMLTLLVTKSGDNIRDTELIVSKLAELTKIPNTVTSVILGTRLFDTIGEVTVFTLAGLGVKILFTMKNPKRN
jgi:multicomponent Na+:H+ antiporter subunit B